ncbi:Rpn family recombination-promoting nuclease/putative transposase, partial [Salmonella enterica subsp. enterica serovar Reading]|nr:Rpn family recombination-promoting nuclease/putative transposase [Salmonella enterica subsp. enterica serovar Reading]
MELHLPAELRAVCDLSTLKLESGSFVEDDLRQYFSDVLYSLKTTAGDGYIHVLVEHQSTPDKHMAFRLIRYAVAALTLLQKHIHQRDLAELVDRLAPILLAGYLSSSQVISLVHYIVQAGETSDAEAFVRELAQRVPQHGDALMTIAQQLEQKGIEKGLQQGLQLGEQRGIEKGRNEGKQEGKLEVARTMLQNGIDRNTVMKMTGLTEDDLAQIRH